MRVHAPRHGHGHGANSHRPTFCAASASALAAASLARSFLPPFFLPYSGWVLFTSAMAAARTAGAPPGRSGRAVHQTHNFLVISDSQPTQHLPAPTPATRTGGVERLPFLAERFLADDLPVGCERRASTAAEGGAQPRPAAGRTVCRPSAFSLKERPQMLQGAVTACAVNARSNQTTRSRRRLGCCRSVARVHVP